jgi:tRNA pseudouridine38-40 synthase
LNTYKLLIEYDGTNLHGWQIQPGRKSVQGLIESALGVLLDDPAAVVGSGRTDAGVHARGQVAHFKTPAAIDTTRVRGSLNGLLPRTVRILGLTRVDDDFHARYDAVRRTYRYYISTEPRALDAARRWLVRPEPDFGLMNRCAILLAGEKHFGAFCRSKSETKNRVCRVEAARWVEEERPGDWYFEISANRFLYGMVRAIVGTLIEIGRGYRPADELEMILSSRDRRMAGQSAPALGLVLERVEYEDAE